ncbi:hypothetical protein [Streptomyces sp. AK02-01A]|uniref:hypothetical protein n=1 Tax=Streptomyces sp. AK02-01A TaxID=3028648 RepID=UPI0029AC05C9|nr:hypothetical protein [Streptomyces sp. AK02-01A]MDX3854915.1 hypothetical protein [Streptomyces sp. AK02-01A]
MTGQPAFGLSFDPRALTDLLQAPGDVRHLALGRLQDLVNADLSGDRLTGELDGHRALDVGARTEWRLLYGHRPAPPASAYDTDIHVIAVRPGSGRNEHDAARIRLARTLRPTSALAYAARARSPQLDAWRAAITAQTSPYALPVLMRPRSLRPRKALSVEGFPHSPRLAR